MPEEQPSNDYKKVIEAALFVSGRAMGADELAKVVGIASVGAMDGIMQELMADYDRRDSSLYIMKLGDKYIMSVREAYIGRVNQLAGPPEISKGGLRILAYISREEPAAQSTVVKNFGSSSYGYIKELLEKDFITAKKSGRTKKLETTSKFKEYFNF